MKKGTILSATWGYSMVLKTWVRVVDVGKKTLLVEEIEGRSATKYERKGLTTAYLQDYTILCQEIS